MRVVITVVSVLLGASCARTRILSDACVVSVPDDPESLEARGQFAAAVTAGDVGSETCAELRRLDRVLRVRDAASRACDPGDPSQFPTGGN